MSNTATDDTNTKTKTTFTPKNYKYENIDWDNFTKEHNLPEGVRVKFYREALENNSPTRVVCVAVVVEHDTRDLYFAGSIWNADEDTPYFKQGLRAKIRKTALERLRIRPNVYNVPQPKLLTDSDDPKKNRLLSFMDIARQQMRIMGVRGPKDRSLRRTSSSFSYPPQQQW